MLLRVRMLTREYSDKLLQTINDGSYYVLRDSEQECHWDHTTSSQCMLLPPSNLQLHYHKLQLIILDVSYQL